MDKKNTVVGEVPEKFNRRRIPKIPLLIVALLVGSIGGYVLVKSFAATQNSNCFSVPSKCGYPDATNTGVPAGTNLTPSGSITVSTPNTTIDSKDVTGTIEVAANNVTIQNSRVTLNFNHPIDKNCTDVTQVTCGNYEIIIDDGVTGTIIKNSELRISSNNIYCEHDIRNLGKDVTITGDYLHGCDSNLFSASSASITDTYGIANQGTATEHIATDHIENVYLNDSKLTVDHSTLFNPVDQTAVIFADSNGGSHGGACSNQITVKNSLLAGGGYTIYPCGNAGSAGSSKISITDNHFARCLTNEINASGGSHPCSGGPDSNGYYPGSGAFGIAAYYFSNQTWSGNVWDNDLQAVCADGNDGCGDNGNPVTTPSDTSPPAVSMTAPQNGTTVSGSSVPVSATASDDTGVVGVQFQLDGSNLNKEDTSIPYSINWDTTGVANGSHTLKAIARDAAGNTNSSSVTVTVANATGGTGGGTGGTGGVGCTVAATPSNFTSVFSGAGSGAVICLAAGSYGTFSGGMKSSMITIRPQDGVAASQVTMKINFSPASNITINGVTILTDSLIGNSQTKHITIKNSDFPGQITLNASELANADILFDHNVHHDFNATDQREGRIFVPNANDSTQTVGVTIQNSQFVNGNSDGIQNGATGLQILNNEFKGIVQVDSQAGVHADSIQLLGSKNTLISGNYFHNDEDGIMCADGCDHENIQNNVFAITNSPFAITLLSDNGSSITHNTFPDAACNFNQRCGKIMVGNKSGDAASKGTIVKDNILNSTADSNGNPSVAGLAQEDYNLLAGPQKNAGSHDITGKPTYSSGTNPSTYSGFALACGSLGKDNASDGTDRGINISGSSCGGGTGADTTAPTVSITAPVSNATVSGIITVNADAKDNVGVSKVEFYVDGATSPTFTASTAPYVYSIDTKTLGNGSHTIKAKAYDAAGNFSSFAAVTVTVSNDTTAPTTPSNLSATAISPTQVNLTWGASTDSGSGVVTYNVLRNDAVIAQVTSTNYSDNTAVANTNYTYYVQAIDGAGNVSANSNTVNLTTPSAGGSGGTQTDKCFSKPSACGYPDATNTGVPAGTALTASGSVTASTNGQVIQGKDISGKLTINAPNVTLKNSKVHTTSGGSGETAIELNQGATNFTIENSEVYGNGSKTNAPESGIWNHYGNAGFKISGSYVHGSPDNVEGPVDVENSYMIVDAEYNGAHSENIYVCGAPATVNHSTLYNQSDETSLIFGDGICGTGNQVSVTGSLLAGGGWMLQPDSKGVSAPVTITNNRVGRCLTSVSQDSGGGYVCKTGADSNGYWPYGGHYGLATDLGKVTWSGNVWDDNSKTICPTQNGTGSCDSGSSGGSDTTAPTTPTNLKATAPSANQVNLTWSASTDSGTGVAGYNIYRNGSKLNSSLVTTTSYGDGTVSASTTYTYTVEAVDGAGNNSAKTGEAKVTTPVQPDSTPPSTPSNLKATATNSTEVDLTWSASTDSGGAGLAGYNVYRNGQQLNAAPVTGTTYQDAKVSPSTTYQYAVQAVDKADNTSDKTASVSATTPAGSTTGNSGGLLVGNKNIQAGPDNDTAGSAEAFKYKAVASGQANTLSLYIDRGSAAGTVIAGLYSNNKGKPGTLLASGSLNAPATASWNTITLNSSPTITSGTTYWIAVLGVNGTVNFRDATTGNCSQSSAQNNLRSLPASWSVGTLWPTCNASAYVSSSSTSTGGSTPSTIAVTVTGSQNKPVAGATVAMNGQAALTDSRGIAHFNFSNLSAGKYTVAVSYNGKHVSQPVQVAKNASQNSPQAIQVKLASDKFNPALILVPVVVLMIAGAYFTRPWERLAEASIGEAADHVITSDNRPSEPSQPAPGHPHHQAPGTVYSPHDTSKTEKHE